MSGQESATDLEAQSRAAAIEAFRKRPEGESGWDRVHEMYTMAQGNISPELQVVPTSIKTGFYAGLAMGFLKEWQLSKDVFIRQHKANTFVSKQDYMRSALNYQMLASARGAVRLCWRVGLFTGFYTWSTMTCAMYTNRLSAKEYALSGALSGALYQMKVGLSGAIVGGLVGGIMSGAMGFVIQMMLKTNGYDFPALRYELHLVRLKKWEKQRQLETEREAERLLKEARQLMDGENEDSSGRL